MIKVIAFDFVGVLVKENDFELTTEEASLERLFGKNYNDNDYIMKSKEYINRDTFIIKTTEKIINNIYDEKYPKIFKNIKNIYKDIKIVIATNHVSYVRNYIVETFGIEFLDNIYISAEMNCVKPEKEYYEYILNKENISANELLFLDDSIANIKGAMNLGISTIHVENQQNLLDLIIDIIEKTAA